MVKYIALAAALIVSLMAVDSAQARGRRGCASCGGCPGGVCPVPMAAPAPAPMKSAAVESATPVVTAPAPAPATTAAQPAPQTYASYPSASYSVRRGLFGWRR